MSKTAVKTKITFQKPTIDDQDTVNHYLRQSHQYGCEFSFANLLLWADHYHASFAVVEDMLVIRTVNGAKEAFSFPVGGHSPKAAIDSLIGYCRAEGHPLVLTGVTNEMAGQLEELYPGQFDITPNRDSFDYIYLSEKLISLSGKKLHGKRNHINKFKTAYPDWRYEAVTPENMQECIALAVDWCRINGCDDDGRLSELCYINQAFHHYDRLGLRGGLLRAGGKAVAFTLGEALNDEVFVVHIEKAYADVQGAYPMINREFIAAEASSYRYINREEDLGMEGLRKAKLSYRPELLLEKHTAVLQ